MMIEMGSLLTEEFLLDKYGDYFSKEACSSILKLNDKFLRITRRFNGVLTSMNLEEISSEKFLNSYMNCLTSEELDYDDDKKVEILFDRIFKNGHAERLNNGNILTW